MLDIAVKEPFSTKFFQERAYDAGGPMRDVISDLCNELMSETLPLLRPTANNQSNLEPETECFQLNERTKESLNLLKYSFLGYLMGWSLLSFGSLNLDLPSAFWARLAGGLSYVYSLEDVRSQDILLASSLERISTGSLSLSEEEFTTAFSDQVFVLNASQEGQVVELCPGGSTRFLTKQNAAEYVTLYL